MTATRAAGPRRPQLTERLGNALAASSAGRAASGLRKRVVPNHWSFMFAEVALYSFVVVLLTGLFLAFFFDPSSATVAYRGPYEPLSGIELSRALDSTLHISFEVTGGLLVRQAHHWAALLLLAAIAMHLLATFFTGAFRRPRRLSWLVAVAVFVLCLLAGWTGYALPDDMLSGTGLRIVHGVILGIPVVGTWLAFLVFGGEFPGEVIAGFYAAHAVVVPLLIVAAIVGYALLLLVRRPAQFPGPGRRNDNVVGMPLPRYAVLSGGLFFLVAGVIVLMAATVTINPVWTYGPSSPGDATAGSQPDWYMGFLDGALRLVPPGWEFEFLGRTVTLAVLAPLAVVGAFLTMVALYPFFEEWITGDRREHHLLDRPRNAPTRTGVGVAGMVFFATLWGAAGSDIIATRFGVSIEAGTAVSQGILLGGPVLGFVVARRIALALQRRDRERVLHGVQTGVIVRMPGGGYAEVRRPLDADERWRLVDYEEHRPLILRPDERGRITLRQRLRSRLSGFFYRDRVGPATRSELPGPGETEVSRR
jgi:ubiquinol-cytochrome c reductase cytochrome b subunit